MAEGRRALMDAEIHTMWEVARWQSVFILQPHMKKGKSVKPKDLAVFPWEADTVKPPTAAEVEALRRYALEEFERDKARAIKKNLKN